MNDLFALSTFYGTTNTLPYRPGRLPPAQPSRQRLLPVIQKIYQIDPLLCPKCRGPMKVISFIEDDALIKKILNHLGLLETWNHDPPQSDDTHIPAIEAELTYDYTYSQLPPIDYWIQ